ncbi:MAG: murein hydrolase activator EnvC [Actinomycetota bacterium]
MPARRPTAAALILVGALTLPASAGPRDRLERIDRDRSRIENKLERVRARGDDLATTVAGLDRRRANVERRVEDLTERIDGLDRSIATVEGRLEEAQRQLALLMERLAVIQARLDASERLFQERAATVYMEGPTDALDTLLSSQTLSDLLDRAQYYESALDADSSLIEEIELLEDEVLGRRNSVERKKDQIAADRAALQEQRLAVAQIRDDRADALAAREAAVARKKSLLANVRARTDKLAAIESQLARESDRIGALLASRSAGAVLPPPGGRLAWPASGPLTSGFGPRIHPIFGESRMHTGIDIGAPYGAPVWAAAGGVVTYAGTLGGYGNTVVIEHGGGLATTYNHLSAYEVVGGEHVSRGQQIAAVGCTGYCTGPHLHFEVRVNGTPVDPMAYLR